MTEERLLVRVTFRKQVSDGNYGTEAAEITLEEHVYESETDAVIVDDLFDDARQYVHDQLAKSPSVNVRNTVARAAARKPAPPAPTADPEDLPF